MLASIRKARDENEEGFTLIELLVVMIIIGILAAIAIPVFLSQKNKAKDSSAKSDVSVIGKDVASFYVDGTGTLTIGGTSPAWSILSGVIVTDSGTLSTGNTIPATVALGGGVISSDGNWCVAVISGGGTAATPVVYSYSADKGLKKNGCTAASPNATANASN